MTRSRILVLLLLGAGTGTGTGACVGGGSPLDQAPGKRIALAVSPLALPGIGDACYDVRVTHQGGDPAAPGDEVVWSAGVGASGVPGAPEASPGERGALCASQFGNGAGGDIAYVGPCDATGNGTHLVTVWVDNLYDGAADPLAADSWENPCPPTGDGCALAFTCHENEDTAVTFNVTIMRDADQGFFDVAVVFDDIFCSAKVDNCVDGQDINLLFDPVTGDRTKTLVFAFACSGGAVDSNETELFLEDLSVFCSITNFPNANVILDSSLGVGNHNVTGNKAVTAWALYRGVESLDCGVASGSCRKLYWNAAMVVNAAKKGCRLQTRATARGATDAFAGGDGALKFTTPADTIYAYLNVNVPLTGASGWLTTPANNTSGCINVPLGDSGLTAAYTAIVDAAPTTIDFCNAFAPSGVRRACDDEDSCTSDLCYSNGCGHSAIPCYDDNECHVQELCVDGACTFPNVADGTPCTGGECLAGVCQ